jgi:hypothetical protein
MVPEDRFEIHIYPKIAKIGASMFGTYYPEQYQLNMGPNSLKVRMARFP